MKKSIILITTLIILLVACGDLSRKYNIKETYREFQKKDTSSRVIDTIKGSIKTDVSSIKFDTTYIIKNIKLKNRDIFYFIGGSFNNYVNAQSFCADISPNSSVIINLKGYYRVVLDSSYNKNKLNIIKSNLINKGIPNVIILKK